jgi:hypothetical protein
MLAELFDVSFFDLDSLILNFRFPLPRVNV